MTMSIEAAAQALGEATRETVLASRAKRTPDLMTTRPCERGAGWQRWELILEDAPIEITGFSMPEIDQIVIGEEPAAVETGPLAPEPDAKPIDPQIRRAGGEECQTAFWDGL
jgi:hypothetical protein